jgi:DNA-binding LacI/PurR family transcriptional regulator
MPQYAAGIRIEPPVSVPSASAQAPAATSAAEPPEDPPEVRAGSRHEAPTEEGGWRAVTRLPGREGLPTACGVGSLNQLFGVLAALRHAGIGVPSQMSVVSFDEDECLAFLDVPVTSVAMPLADLGSAAVDALIARIEREPARDVMVRQPMNLVPRDSVTHPPRS